MTPQDHETVSVPQQLAAALARCKTLDAVIEQLRSMASGAEISDANAVEVLRGYAEACGKTVKQRDAALVLLREVL